MVLSPILMSTLSYIPPPPGAAPVEGREGAGRSPGNTRVLGGEVREDSSALIFLSLNWHPIQAGPSWGQWGTLGTMGDFCQTRDVRCHTSYTYIDLTLQKGEKQDVVSSPSSQPEWPSAWAVTIQGLGNIRYHVSPTTCGGCSRPHPSTS